MKFNVMSIIEAIQQHAEANGIRPEIVYGVCVTESGLNPYAVRYEPKYRWTVDCVYNLNPATCSIDTEYTLQKTSIGLMQVMGAVIREYGFKGWLTEVICDIDLQLSYGCQHLKKKIDRYGERNGILAYNSGSPRFLKNGDAVNQYYMDRVLKHSYEYEWRK